MESRLFQPYFPLYGFLPLIAFQSGQAINPALTGVADVAAAKLAYDRAKAAGLGTELEW